jgi:hypothetical protein
MHSFPLKLNSEYVLRCKNEQCNRQDTYNDYAPLPLPRPPRIGPPLARPRAEKLGCTLLL